MLFFLLFFSTRVHTLSDFDPYDCSLFFFFPDLLLALSCRASDKEALAYACVWLLAIRVYYTVECVV